MKKSMTAWMTVTLLITVILHPVMVFPQSTAIQPADKYADKLRIFEEFVRKEMEKNNLPGVTIGFYKDDYVWVKGFGYADLENRVPAKAESAYRLHSMSDRRREPFTNDPQELIKAFDYFNRVVNLGSLQSNYQTTFKAIEDGLHPVAGSAFINVGSFMSAKLREKHGAERDKVYHTMGELYAQKGQKESAIQAYQKALEADPAFEHAREMLKKFAP